MQKDKKDIVWKIYLIYFSFFCILLFVIFKTFAIQNEGVSAVLEGEKTEEKIPTKTIPRFPRKGEILDCNRTPLLTSISSFDIYMDPTVVSQEIFDKKLEALCDKLSYLFKDKASSEYALIIRKARINKKRFVLIKKRVNNEQRNKLRLFPIFELGRNKGGLIDTEEEIERKRPHGELLKRTLGYYQKNKDGELRVGIEGAYHSYLIGEPGLEIAQKISTGWKKTGQIVKDAIEGANIITTFDKEIQEVAHSELYSQLKSHNAISGSVVVMDVKTGYVRAMANLTRDANGEYYELYNHAVGTKEVPGSTFKLASLMAALEDNKIDINSKVESDRSYNFFGETINEAHNNYYGTISIKEAFELSSNVISKVIYQAYKNEPNTFIERLKSFGLANPLGLDIAGEPNPTLYSPGSSHWWRGSLAWIAVGYDVQLTPLQTLTFYNAVANNGKMVKPQFVQEITRGTESVSTFSPIILKERICSNNTLKILQSCLEGVMKKGTGKRLHSSYFDIAGKTGTAEILNDNLKYGNKGEKRYLASFVGYFPIKDPIFSCIVTITANGDNIYGATVSGTVFSAIANKVYASSLKYHKAINESNKKSENLPKSKDGNKEDLYKILKKLGIHYGFESDYEWVSSKSSSDKLVYQKKYMGKKTVPNVIGLTAKDAVYLIENTGMNVGIIGYGSVKKQSVPAGTPVFKGGLIELFLE